MLLAGVSGHGTIDVNSTAVQITPETIAVLPWAHHVRYRPDRQDPYLVYGAHLIPRNDPEVPVELSVAHRPTDPLAGAWWRSDADLAIGPELYVTDAESHPTLYTLIKLIAQIWDRGQPGLNTALALGELAMTELNTTSAVLPQNDRRLPLRLRRALTFIMADLSRQMTLAEISAAADCSDATLARLFRHHLDSTPLAWVLRMRIKTAQRMLTTTRLSIQQIATRVGIQNSYYFSRKFRQQTGVTPTEWRRRRAAP